MSIAEKLTTVAENVPKVYEAGQKSEYDRFWDSVQQSGARANYNTAFARWDMDYIRPKYKVIPTHSNAGGATFQESTIKKVEKEYFDFSQKPCGTGMSSWYYTFQGCNQLEEIEDIGMQPSHYTYTFSTCYKLHTIAVLRCDESSTWSNAFYLSYALKNIVIEGKIGQKGFNVSSCTSLTKESLLSILQALSLDITATTTITFSTEHQSTIETDEDCSPYWEAAVNAGWSFVYA